MFVVGDSGFEITNKLINTYTILQMRTNALKKERFNYYLSRVRVRIEQLFGIVKAIFPYLGYLREVNPI